MIDWARVDLLKVLRHPVLFYRLVVLGRTLQHFHDERERIKAL